ncbi:MAG: hypothetical protein JWR52_1674 [Marmoricola sp.]|nr:hypothetical protein [Marmoricola sp.]
MTPRHAEHHRDVARGLLSWAALIAAFAVVVICVAWRVEGGRWERVETASMGTVAPVGTLLWIKPVDFASLEPGDFITFRPPGTSGVTYSHRVLRRDADGTIMTKGVLSAPDPWRLGPGNIVGKVAMHWWGVGWLLAAAPLLVLGGVVIALATRVLSAPWKLPAVLILGSMVLSVLIVWQRPLVNAQQLAFSPAPHGGADATYVGTGLLPIRLSAASGPHVVLKAGQVGTVHVAKSDGRGWLHVTLSPAIPWWWWIGLVGVCFLPAISRALGGLVRPRSAVRGNRHRHGPSGSQTATAGARRAVA